MTKEDILQFLRDKKEYLAHNFGVRSIGLFGSYVRGEATKESDIDLVVDMPPSFDAYYDLKEFLEEAFKKPIDLGLKNSVRKFIYNKIEKEIIYA